VVKLPVCFEPRSAATALRATLERLGWEYTRSDDTRAFTQVAFVIPFQRAAHLFRYEIPHGDLLLELWAETPGSSGSVTWLEVRGDAKPRRELLTAFAEGLPRRPWEFTLGQRLRVGLLSVRGARRKWEKALQ
jgi:hypothetical protein